MSRTLLGALFLSLTGCFNGLLLTPTQVSQPVEETLVSPADRMFCADKIAIIDVEGVLMNARSSGLLGSGDNPVSLFRERLEAAGADPRVKAVVVRINSPGGGVTASDIMYRDLEAFRQQTGKPVVACMMDVAASGGFYVAMASDKVYAHPTTVTGSIGVIMNLYDASRLFNLVGVKSEAIKSGVVKDMGNPGRPLTPEERALLQNMVANFHDQFVQVVCRGRNRCMNPDGVRALADGRVFTGTEARRLGLVDEVGYLEDALQCAFDLAGLKDARVVAYEKGAGYRGSIYAGLPSQINVKLEVPGLDALPAAHGPGFMYLWQPGVR